VYLLFLRSSSEQITSKIFISTLRGTKEC
jgi:hypothetical protein